MIILDATTKKLEMVLSAAIATTQPDFVSSYVDLTTSAFTSVEQDGVGNSTTDVTIVSSPAASTQRQVKFISITNKDTASITVTVNYNNNGTKRRVYKATLPIDYTLTYTDGDGWRVWDTTGALLTSPTATVVYVATRVLTNAEVIKLPSTTYSIGPTPVSGYALRPLALSWTKKATGGAWTGTSATYATLQLQTTSGVWVSDIIANDNSLTTPLTRLTDFLGGANTRVAFIACPYNEPVQAAASGDVGYNAPVVTASTTEHDGIGMELAMYNNGSATDLGGGNAANTLRATVYYALEAL